MIWQENIQTVVMVTKLKESEGKVGSWFLSSLAYIVIFKTNLTYRRSALVTGLQ